MITTYVFSQSVQFWALVAVVFGRGTRRSGGLRLASGGGSPHQRFSQLSCSSRWCDFSKPVMLAAISDGVRPSANPASLSLSAQGVRPPTARVLPARRGAPGGVDVLAPLLATTTVCHRCCHLLGPEVSVESSVSGLLIECRHVDSKWIKETDRQTAGSACDWKVKEAAAAGPNSLQQAPHSN